MDRVHAVVLGCGSTLILLARNTVSLRVFRNRLSHSVFVGTFVIAMKVAQAARKEIWGKGAAADVR